MNAVLPVGSGVLTRVGPGQPPHSLLTVWKGSIESAEGDGIHCLTACSTL